MECYFSLCICRGTMISSRAPTVVWTSLVVLALSTPLHKCLRKLNDKYGVAPPWYLHTTFGTLKLGNHRHKISEWYIWRFSRAIVAGEHIFNLWYDTHTICMQYVPALSLSWLLFNYYSLTLPSQPAAMPSPSLGRPANRSGGSSSVLNKLSRDLFSKRK